MSQVVETVEIPALFDAHVHLRQGRLLETVAIYTDAVCCAAVVMPNIDPPVDSPDRLRGYQMAVGRCLSHCRPLYTFKITCALADNPQWLNEYRDLGAVAGKLYPVGVTTNSHDGLTVQDLVFQKSWLGPVLGRMQDLGLVLSVHGEWPGSFCLDRETDFHATLRSILHHYPNLKVVLEHISTAASCQLAAESFAAGQELAVTITAHHLCLTLDDVIGGLLRPHHFCKPIAKREEDRRALVRLATSGIPNVFLGSDSAPHPRGRKESDCGCAGIFSAPVLAPKLAETFEAVGRLDRLPEFACRRAEDFYGQKPTGRIITLRRDPWRVPDDLGGVVPWLAGETLSWRVHLRDPTDGGRTA